MTTDFERKTMALALLNKDIQFTHDLAANANAPFRVTRIGFSGWIGVKGKNGCWGQNYSFEPSLFEVMAKQPPKPKPDCLWAVCSVLGGALVGLILASLLVWIAR